MAPNIPEEVEETVNDDEEYTALVNNDDDDENTAVDADGCGVDSDVGGDDGDADVDRHIHDESDPDRVELIRAIEENLKLLCDRSMEVSTLPYE
ncbi:hypothetical protein CYMTET_3756 [Cymbomonas tetramitiformis]|uniref:Uncharacterized protein n=1 Tax=Cymbomonas tetramitiformis TaxID=36881 RepID=A0AAE0LL66_9CHLO|nr:hypothetical protein CYMTET_3756 [Cymbomonas tetramitiformis]|eukprot:gene24251-29451_t